MRVMASALLGLALFSVVGCAHSRTAHEVACCEPYPDDRILMRVPVGKDPNAPFEQVIDLIEGHWRYKIIGPWGPAWWVHFRYPDSEKVEVGTVIQLSCYPINDDKDNP